MDNHEQPWISLTNLSLFSDPLCLSELLPRFSHYKNIRENNKFK